MKRKKVTFLRFYTNDYRLMLYFFIFIFLGDVNWLRYRIFAFLQRPNAAFRGIVKSFLNNVYVLGSEDRPLSAKMRKKESPCIGIPVEFTYLNQ